MDNFVFTEEQYKKLQQEYLKQTPQFNRELIAKLNCIIKTLENNSFQLPIELQNASLNKLLQAKELLNILYIDNSTTSLTLPNNPFALINLLTQISIDLNLYSLENIYKIISIKANNLILETIGQISNYFKDKNIKIFKFY